MNKPKIRFKGFEGEWEKVKIGEVANVIGGGTPSTNNSIYWDGPIQWFTPSEVGQIKYIEKSQRTITTAGLEKSSAKLIPANSVLLSSRATIGEMSINTCECTTNQGFQSLVPCKIDLEFLYSLMLTKKNDLIRISHGSTFLEISASKVRSVNICVPKLDEQQEIGTYFKQLDSLISLTEKKISSLKQVKQASLQSMFPQEGETTPRIRFKGFDGEWKKNFVSNLCKIGTGKSNTQDQVVNGTYPFYIRSEKIAQSNKYLYDCEAVITIGDGNIGKVFHYVNGKFDLHQRCYKMTEFKDISGQFFYHVFSAFFYDRVIRMSAKATVDSVRMDMIAKMEIFYPTLLEEQTQIANYFTNLDKQIALHEARLAKLKSVKTSCLDLMFV